MNKSFQRSLVVATGIIAGFLLLGTMLAYTLSAIYSQFLIDVDDFPLPIGALFALILIPTDIVGESFGEMLSLNGTAFFISWSTMLVVITFLSYFTYKKLYNNKIK